MISERLLVDSKLILFKHVDDFGDHRYEDVAGHIYKRKTRFCEFWHCEVCGKEHKELGLVCYAGLRLVVCEDCVRIPTIHELLHAFITEMKGARKGN